MKALICLIYFFSLAAFAEEELKLEDSPAALAPTAAPVNSVEKEVQTDKSERVIKVQHPNAAKGLIRINKDGSYQYKVKLTDKSQASSFNLVVQTPPKVTTNVSGLSISYSSMYGASNLTGLNFNYEWMPFRKFGALGLLLESGFSVSRGRGTLKANVTAEEQYTLIVIPLGAFLKYRFEYARKQWLVPYVEGGGFYYGMVETRDDDAAPKLAGSSAVGGGGGVLINISKLDPEGSFRLNREWGVSDMWLNISGRALAGLKKDIDFTNTAINIGVTVDY